MATISDSTSAAYSNANVRSELATNAIRDNADQEQQVAQLLQESQSTQQLQETDREERDARRAPGTGEAVDISV